MKSRYIPVTQQPYCCTAACLQMVMYRLKVPIVSQEDIANALGLIVPKKDLHLFNHARTGNRPESGWGTHIQNKEYDLSTGLKRLKTGLSARYYLFDRIRSVNDLQETLRDLQKEDANVLICFDYSSLWGGDGETGHVSVFDFIDGDFVHLIDPEYKVPKNRKASVSKLYEAMKKHGANNMAGLWLIEKTKQSN